MLSISEMAKKSEQAQRRIRSNMDASKPSYHPDMKILKEGDTGIWDGISSADQLEVKESLRQVSLSQLLEFLAKSGTAGIAGGAYLVPVKAHDLLVNYTKLTDRVPVITSQIIRDWKGDQWKISVADDDDYIPHSLSSGGAGAQEEATSKQLTLNLTAANSFSVNINVGNDLLEDVTDYDVVEWHIKEAAKVIGFAATDQAVKELFTCTDGWGTLNAQAASADETTYAQILAGMALIGNDRWTPNTMVITLEAWRHSVGATAAALPGLTTTLPQAPDYDMKLQTLDVVFSSAPYLHLLTEAKGAAMTNCSTMVFDRFNTLLTGRKRWLALGRYSDPVKDLAGAVVTGFQDSVSLYNDACCKILET